MSETLGQLPSVGSWLCIGENPRASHSEVKVLLTEETGRVRAISEGKRGSRVRGGQFLLGWVIS